MSLLEALKNTPRAPCDDCRHRADCAVTGLVCRAFQAYVDGRSGSAWKKIPRCPSERLTAQARAATVAAASEQAGEIARIEKLAYMRIWRTQNRDRVRAHGRARYARLKASFPEQVAQRRAYERAWKRAHPGLSPAVLRWRAANPSKVRAARRRYYHANREKESAVNRAWRATHRERVRELQKIWHELHRAEINARKRARYAENPSRFLERNRLWRTEHRERLNERQRARYAGNQPLFRERERLWRTKHRERVNEQQRVRRLKRMAASSARENLHGVSSGARESGAVSVGA